jgi:hypothetical protein
MANGQGTATIDFGAYPGSNEAFITVTGLATISATSKAEAFVMADDTTADHTANDHKYITMFMGLSCGTPVAATGFTIYGRSTDMLQGTFAIRYVWSD